MWQRLEVNARPTRATPRSLFAWEAYAVERGYMVPGSSAPLASAGSTGLEARPVETST